ncbi:MAG TPA: acetyl-CoA carboxylase biotin carboxyl carrier protein subunit [Candidatus Limnocylindria bacterium]|nr:acetyl-CoA carboxylase biotin carboxyl carrier protein subunit [Candidatus Limnocylindria bacterium]
MTRLYHVEVSDRKVEPVEGWTLTWLDRSQGIARVTVGERSATVVVEGGGSSWFVVLDGRRIPVTVRTRREQLLAEAEVSGGHHGGPIEVRASLPGLVVALRASPGDDVEEGAPLVTIEAMKMQNEVRAPRAGRVSHVAVADGQPVATGALLVRIE